LFNLGINSSYHELLIYLIDEGCYQFFFTSTYQYQTSDDKIYNNTFFYDNYIHHHQLCLNIRHTIQVIPTKRRASYTFDRKRNTCFLCLENMSRKSIHVNSFKYKSNKNDMFIYETFLTKMSINFTCCLNQ
jgi:hypothetical protein